MGNKGNEELSCKYQEALAQMVGKDKDKFKNVFSFSGFTAELFGKPNISNYGNH